MPDNLDEVPRARIPLYESSVVANAALKGKRVSVYWNARKSLYSVLDPRTRRVVAHTKGLVITNPRFRVNQKTRRKVVDTHKEIPHAFISGTIEDVSSVNSVFKVQYIPYVHESFMYYNGSQFKPIRGAGKAELAINNGNPFMNVDEIRIG